MKKYCIVTTINPPTKAIEVLYEKFGKNLIVVGDEKTPKDWEYKDAQYILDLPEEKWYSGYAPKNSYARKNLGYMEAIRQGADFIYSTDDDNIPNENWSEREVGVNTQVSIREGWYNAYTVLCNSPIWPRGFSLKQLGHTVPYSWDNESKQSSIQQGLADGEPDVDAIWRLTSLEKGHTFPVSQSIYLQHTSWCPINSQSTWYFPKAYPLMYLPVYATMRMCDIWGGFVAQRCLWEIGEGVTFHSPSEVFQDRNEHDLLADFKDEIPGYLHNDEIVEILQNLELKKGEEYICENMLTCYQAIVDKGFLPEMEIRSLNKWIRDYEIITKPVG